MKLYPGMILADESGAKFVLVPLERKDKSPLDGKPRHLAGAEIRKLRKSRGWTQEKLAEESKLTQATVSNIEKGKEEPYASTLDALWMALNTF